jgi:hypothetical protein
MKAVRLAVTALAAGALVPLSATTAFADAPDNDFPSHPVMLHVGQTVNEDTSEATTGAFDAKLNQVCGAPFTNASVWFTYTPSADGSFLVDMSSSSYTGGFMIFQNHVTQRGMIACGPETVGADVTAGVKYTIVAFSDTETNGGKLVMTLQEGPPPPDLSVTVNPTGKAFSDGTAQVGGTYSCSNADFVELDGDMVQIWKRVKITGFFGRFFGSPVCDGAAHNWKAIVSSDNGLYAKGNATVDVFPFACGLVDCVENDVLGVPVTLKDGGKAPAGLAKLASEPSSVKLIHSSGLYSTWAASTR